MSGARRDQDNARAGATLAGAEPFAADGDDVGVLLIHGFTGSPASMRPWAEHLASQGRTVRLPLLPGHGTRWQDLNATCWQDWYDAAEAAFRELQSRCGVVIVIGLSMGGTLATRLTQLHPSSVDGVVLVNPAFRVDDRRMMALPVLKTFIASLPGIADDIAKPDQQETGYNRLPLRALYSQTKLWAKTVERLDEVRAPVLLFRSAVDHVVPASSTRLFLSRIASDDVTVVVLPDSHHVATLDFDAARIESDTDAFIARLCSSTRSPDEL